MTIKKAAVLVLATVSLYMGASIVMPVETRPQPAQATDTAVFDYSGCQYPDRTTNPPDGCDNSDPCDPANVKGGSGDCTPIGTAEKQEAIAEHSAPFQPAGPVTQCGGSK